MALFAQDILGNLFVFCQRVTVRYPYHTTTPTTCRVCDTEDDETGMELAFAVEAKSVTDSFPAQRRQIVTRLSDC